MSSIDKVVFSKIQKIETSKFFCDKTSTLSAQLSELTKDTFEKISENAVFSKATFEKAKDIVIETIAGANPKESCVYVMDDKIIHYELGDIDSIHITDTMNALLNNPKNRIAIIHSHPQNLGPSTMPVSYQDFMAINDCEAARSIYAINKQGEYSLLEKASKQRPSFLKVLNYETKNYNEAGCTKLYEDILSDRLDEIKSLMPENSILSEDLILVLESLAKKDSELASKLSYLAGQEALEQHKFWLKYAPELGLKYDTNYSCFK